MSKHSIQNDPEIQKWMENRIEINGVWYIREDSIDIHSDNSEEENEFDFVWTEGCTYETDKYCFEVTRIRKGEDGDFYPDLMINFTDKRFDRRNDWINQIWDNNNWFIGILENNPESLVEFKEALCPVGQRQFITLLRKLVDIGWLKLK